MTIWVEIRSTKILLSCWKSGYRITSDQTPQNGHIYVISSTSLEVIVTMDDTGLKSLKLPLFDGEEKNFQIWWTRFWAYAGCHGFTQAIGTMKNVNLPDHEDETLDETVAAEQLKILARRKNLVAMANLTLANDDRRHQDSGVRCVFCGMAKWRSA